jgi:hypothetical protein
MYLFPNIPISEEEPRAEILGSDVFTVPDDQFADASEHDILDGLRRDTAQIDHENRGVSHPIITPKSIGDRCGEEDAKGSPFVQNTMLFYKVEG